MSPQRMTDKCFRKCIGKPGGSLDNSEQVRPSGPGWVAVGRGGSQAGTGEGSLRMHGLTGRCGGTAARAQSAARGWGRCVYLCVRCVAVSAQS